MKRLLLIVSIAFALASSVSAQNVLSFGGSGSPSGVCPTGMVSYRDFVTGQDWDCVAAAWHLTTRTQPIALAAVNLTNQGAAIAATTLYSVPANGAGLYRIVYVAKITRVATTSCALGGTSGFQVIYTDADDSTTNVTTPAGATSAVNALTSQISGAIVVYAKAGTIIQYKIGYTSSGTTTMAFSLHLKIEAL